MADPLPPPRLIDMQPVIEGAIPRVGMSIPMPASTKPPPAPTSQQSSSDKP